MSYKINKSLICCFADTYIQKTSATSLISMTHRLWISDMVKGHPQEYRKMQNFRLCRESNNRSVFQRIQSCIAVTNNPWKSERPCYRKCETKANARSECTKLINSSKPYNRGEKFKSMKKIYAYVPKIKKKTN